MEASSSSAEQETFPLQRWRNLLSQSLDSLCDVLEDLELFCSGGEYETERTDTIELELCDICGTDEIDVKLLLALMNDCNPSSDYMWSQAGLKVNGRKRGVHTLILWSRSLYKGGGIAISNVHVAEVVNQLARKLAAQETDEDQQPRTESTRYQTYSYDQMPLHYKKNTMSMKKYIDETKQFVDALANELQLTREALAALKEKIVKESAVASKWRQFRAQPRNLGKRRRSDNGNFVSKKQRDLAVEHVLKVVERVADTPQKKQTISDAVQEEYSSTTASPKDVRAKCMLADSAVSVLHALTTASSSDSGKSKEGGELRRLRGYFVRSLVPSSAQIAQEKVRKELGQLLGVNCRNREFRQATKWRVELERALHGVDGERSLTHVLLPAQRAKRSDALTTEEVELIARGWREKSEASPNVKDVVKYRETDGHITTHTKYACFQRTVDIREYLFKTYALDVSLTMISIFKPAYVKKGTTDTCVCHYCENVRLLRVAVVQQRDVLVRPLRCVRAYYLLTRFFHASLWSLRMRRAREQAMTSEDVVGTPSNRTLYNAAAVWIDEVRGFAHRFPTVTLSDAFHVQHKSDIVEHISCSGALPEWQQVSARSCGKPRCFGACSEEERCQRCIGGGFRRLLRLSNMKQEHIDAAERAVEHAHRDSALPTAEPSPPAPPTPASTSAATQNTDTIRFRTWGVEGTDHTTAELVNQQLRLTEFEDYCVRKLSKFTEHIATLRRQKYAARQLEQNMLPNMLEVSVDFSENYAMDVARAETQSAHWRTNSATLFICVVRYLCTVTWADTTGALRAHDPVSVEGVNGWQAAAVEQDWPGGSEPVRVRLLCGSAARGTVHDVPRTLLRKRRILTTPIAAVSNDPHHDTAFVQIFLLCKLFGVEGWLAQQSVQFRQDHDMIVINSDGATSHFKQGNTLFFLHELREIVAFARALWNFGCPGHGKGVWDGLGGTIKWTCTRLLLREQRTIVTAKDFYELVRDVFTGDRRAQQQYGPRDALKCEPWHVVYVDVSETEELRARMSGSGNVFFRTDTIRGFSHGAGTRKLFCYEALGSGHTRGTSEYRELGLRIFSCFCEVCVTAAGRDPAESLRKRNARSHQPALPTVAPDIPGCLLQEPWDFQHVRRRRCTAEDQAPAPPPEIHTSTNTEGYDDAQEEVPMVINWAECEFCGKWRIVRRALAPGEAYQCSDAQLTMDPTKASCSAALEEGANEVSEG